MFGAGEVKQYNSETILSNLSSSSERGILTCFPMWFPAQSYHPPTSFGSIYRRQLPHHLPRIHRRAKVLAERHVQLRAFGSFEDGLDSAFLDLIVWQDEFDAVADFESLVW